MSYLIEGVGASGLDAERLARELTAAFGPAAAVVGDPDAPGSIDALLIDRKAETFDALLDRLAAAARAQGWPRAARSDAPGGEPMSVLRFSP
ncbi:MAG TPA: hypothetical protein VG406_26745 [Isosphaeraceae bacterium]|jgi:hypothetical protein|nr:hypothetical protein [Isosphaeraceae bacterium]